MKRTLTHDGEEAISNAWDKITGGIQHLLCLNHFKATIERYLKDKLKIQKEVEKGLILEELFGKNTDSGLIDQTASYIEEYLPETYTNWYKICSIINN